MRLLRQRSIPLAMFFSGTFSRYLRPWWTISIWNFCERLLTKMPNCLVPIIPARWSRLARAVALVSLCALAASAQSLDVLASNYRKTPTPRTRAALLNFANAHSNDKNGSLAFLVLGATEIDQRQFGDALQHLKAAHKHLSKLADYIAYLSPVAQSELREFPETEGTLAPVRLSNRAEIRDVIGQ